MSEQKRFLCLLCWPAYLFSNLEGIKLKEMLEGNKDPVSCSLLSSKETHVKEKAQKKPPLLYIEGVSATASRGVEKSK